MRTSAPPTLTAPAPTPSGAGTPHRTAAPRRRLPALAAALPGLVRFALVGGSGVVVNLVTLAALLRVHTGPDSAQTHALAETAATQVAIAWNFLLTEAWVFPGRADGRRWARFGGFWLLSVASLALQLPLAAALLRVLPGGYVACTAVALAALVALRYLVCHRFLYRPASAPVAEPAAGGVAW